MKKQSIKLRCVVTIVAIIIAFIAIVISIFIADFIINTIIKALKVSAKDLFRLISHLLELAVFTVIKMLLY